MATVRLETMKKMPHKTTTGTINSSHKSEHVLQLKLPRTLTHISLTLPTKSSITVEQTLCAGVVERKFYGTCFTISDWAVSVNDCSCVGNVNPKICRFDDCSSVNVALYGGFNKKG